MIKLGLSFYLPSDKLEFSIAVQIKAANQTESTVYWTEKTIPILVSFSIKYLKDFVLDKLTLTANETAGDTRELNESKFAWSMNVS